MIIVLGRHFTKLFFHHMHFIEEMPKIQLAKISAYMVVTAIVCLLNISTHMLLSTTMVISAFIVGDWLTEGECGYHGDSYIIANAYKKPEEDVSACHMWDVKCQSVYNNCNACTMTYTSGVVSIPLRMSMVLLLTRLLSLIHWLDFPLA